MQTTLTVRTADNQDIADLFRWRNDPETRANSTTTAVITWEEHCRWFAGGDETRRVIYIGTKGGAKIGMVRFDRAKETGHRYVVSVTIDAACRGTGYGQLLLRTACEALLSTRRAALLEAEIKADNHASRCIFAACGFKPHETTDAGLVRYIRTFSAE